jgi:hypothetical protein
MRRTRDLRRLASCCQRRAKKLQTLVDTYLLPIDWPKDRIVAYVTIEAHNLWASFSRAFYLSCALNTSTAAGARVAPTSRVFSGTDDALAAAIRLLKNPRFSSSVITGRDEPAWHVTANLLRLFDAFGLSNLPQVQSALSYPTRYFDLLPKMRNFYAHRSLGTYRIVQDVARQLGVSTSFGSSEILISKIGARPQHVLGDWLEDIGEVIGLICM